MFHDKAKSRGVSPSIFRGDRGRAEAQYGLLGLTDESRAEIQARIADVRRTKAEPAPPPVYPMRMRKASHVVRSVPVP